MPWNGRVKKDNIPVDINVEETHTYTQKNYVTQKLSISEKCSPLFDSRWLSSYKFQSKILSIL